MREKLRKLKEKIKTRFWRTVNYLQDLIANRPEVVVAFLGLMATIARSLLKMHHNYNLNKRVKDEKELKTCYYYDKRHGHYVKTIRPLTGKELLELDKRYKKGESYSEILSSMKLLR